MRATARNDRSKSLKSETRCRLLPRNVVDAGEAFRIHPVREAVAEIFDDAEAVVHDGGADLQAARAQQQELGGILPGGDAAHAGDRLAGPRHDRHRVPSAASMFSAIGFTAGPA